MKRLIISLALALVCVTGFARIVWHTSDYAYAISEERGVYMLLLEDVDPNRGTNVAFIGQGAAAATRTLKMIQEFYKTSKEGDLKIIRDDPALTFSEMADIKCIARNKEDLLIFVGDIMLNKMSVLNPAMIGPMLEALGK